MNMTMSKKDEITVLARFSPDLSSLVIANANKLGRVFRPLMDDDLEITIKKFYRQRSAAQNRWMWGVCIPSVIGFFKETQGESPSKDAIYAWLRTHVLGQELVLEEVQGVEVPIMKSKKFSQMTTVEFSDAVDVIVQYFDELDHEIPLPKEGTNNLITDYL